MGLILIERDGEEAFLREVWSSLSSGEVIRPRAIFVSGPEGRGRSSLLKWAQELTSEARLIAQNWPQGGAGPEALRSILPAAVFTAYDDLGRQLSILESRVEAAQLGLGLPLPGETTDEPRLRAVQAIPPSALHFLIRRLYTIYTPEQMSDQAAAFVKTGLEHIITLTAANLSQLRAFVDDLKLKLTATEWEFYLRPEEVLAGALGRGVAAIGEDKPFLITLDDYALAEGSSDRWLRLVVEESGRTLWLFSATTAPGWAEELKPAPLSASGVAAYFEAKHGRSLSQEETVWLSDLSDGEPLALAIAAELYAGGASASELDAARSRTPADRLEGLFLYFVEESGQLSQQEHAALYYQAVLHEPTPAFLSAFRPLVEQAGYSYDPAWWEVLRVKYGWLFGVGDLHPALKRRLRDYLLLERRRFSQVVQEAIIEPARTLAVARLVACEGALIADPTLKGSLPARARDAEWGALVADLAYYRFWLDEAVGWFFLLPRWLITLAYNEGLARRLLALAESMSRTFYAEGQEILPCMRALLVPSYSGGRTRLDEKLRALEKLEELGTSARGRWYRAENLGQRPESGGSPEAELRGLLKWFQARLLEEAGQFERTAPLYESVLATNVAMPDMERAAARAALYLATRYRLKGAAESAYGSFSRAVELDGQQPEAQRALFYQAVRTQYYQTALKAADALAGLAGYEAQGALYTIFALYVLERRPETQTELRSFLARPPSETAQARPTFQTLANLAKLPPDAPDLAGILAQLPE